MSGRRTISGAVAKLSALAILAVSCTSAGGTPTQTSSAGTGRGATSPSPPGSANRSTETATPIKHVVIIVKENRSFDSVFGRFPGADGTTVGKLHGRTVPLLPATDQRLPHDLPHDRHVALFEWDHGKMDGFGFNATSTKYAHAMERASVRGERPTRSHSSVAVLT